MLLQALVCLSVISCAEGALILISNMVPSSGLVIGKSIKTHEVRGAEAHASVGDQEGHNIALKAATKAPTMMAGLDGINPNPYSYHGAFVTAAAMLYTIPNLFFCSIDTFIFPLSGHTSRPQVTSLLLVFCGCILISILLSLAGFKKRRMPFIVGSKKRREASANLPGFLARCDPALFVPADSGVRLVPRALHGSCGMLPLLASTSTSSTRPS